MYFLGLLTLTYSYASYLPPPLFSLPKPSPIPHPFSYSLYHILLRPSHPTSSLSYYSFLPLILSPPLSSFQPLSSFSRHRILIPLSFLTAFLSSYSSSLLLLPLSPYTPLVHMAPSSSFFPFTPTTPLLPLPLLPHSPPKLAKRKT